MLAAVTKSYIARFRVAARRELHFYGTQKALGAAIRLAALSRTPHDKRHSHQRRIPQQVLEAAERRLQALSARLRKTRSFAELHRVISDEIGSIRGIGDLTIYDVAHRIGAYLGHEPEAVYLHAGAREGGARARFGR